MFYVINRNHLGSSNRRPIKTPRKSSNSHCRLCTRQLLLGWLSQLIEDNFVGTSLNRSRKEFVHSISTTLRSLNMVLTR